MHVKEMWQCFSVYCLVFLLIPPLLSHPVSVSPQWVSINHSPSPTAPQLFIFFRFFHLMVSLSHFMFKAGITPTLNISQKIKSEGELAASRVPTNQPLSLHQSESAYIYVSEFTNLVKVIYFFLNMLGIIQLSYCK